MPGNPDTSVPNAHYVTPFFSFREGVVPDDAAYSEEANWIRLEANDHAADNHLWVVLTDTQATGGTVKMKVFVRSRLAKNGTDQLFLIKEIAACVSGTLYMIPGVPALPAYIQLVDNSDGAAVWNISVAHTLGGRTLYNAGGNNASAPTSV